MDNAYRKKRIFFDLKKFKKSIPLYMLMLPAAIVLILFHYIPIYGIQIAFRDYSWKGGITGSEWVGLFHFKTFIQSARFVELVRNTLSINLLELATFPIPIVFALLLNYCTSEKFKKVVQMVTYAPHFISVVVVVTMIELFLNPSTGVINKAIGFLGGEATNFLMIPRAFKYIFVVSGLWQNLGWSAIIYIGSLAAISPELHEAAIVDGANKLQRMIHVDIPGILTTIITLFIMKIGSMMNLGFQKVYLLQNGANLTASETISTYVYKVGLLQNFFSYSTAIGMFNTVINLLLLVTANYLCRKFTETSLF